MNSRIHQLLLSGLFAALTAICSWLNIMLFFTPVPINMALLAPYLSGLLLGSRYAVLSQIIYVLMGVIGIPVFAGFTAGLGVIIGPTGGFIAGYIICAAVCGLPLRKKGTKHRILLMLAGLMSCYAFGLIWFMYVTESSLWAGLMSCVLPFLPGDAVKIAVAALLAKYMTPALKGLE